MRYIAFALVLVALAPAAAGIEEPTPLHTVALAQLRDGPPEPIEKEYIPDEAEVEMLARLIWGEARGVPSAMEQAAVVWCVLNRVDSDAWPDTVAEVVTQAGQFAGYDTGHPVTDEFAELAADVLTRRAVGGEGRVLPEEYVYFTGDGVRNHFRDSAGNVWDWSLPDPYKEEE